MLNYRTFILVSFAFINFGCSKLELKPEENVSLGNGYRLIEFDGATKTIWLEDPAGEMGSRVIVSSYVNNWSKEGFFVFGMNEFRQKSSAYGVRKKDPKYGYFIINTSSHEVKRGLSETEFIEAKKELEANSEQTDGT